MLGKHAREVSHRQMSEADRESSSPTQSHDPWRVGIKILSTEAMRHWTRPNLSSSRRAFIRSASVKLGAWTCADITARTIIRVPLPLLFILLRMLGATKQRHRLVDGVRIQHRPKLKRRCRLNVAAIGSIVRHAAARIVALIQICICAPTCRFECWLGHQAQSTRPRPRFPKPRRQNSHSGHQGQALLLSDCVAASRTETASLSATAC